jgi:hypothetical protein
MSGDDRASVLTPTAPMQPKPYSERMNETGRQHVPAGSKRRSPKLRRLGKLPPRFTFFLNPYPDVRFTTCPNCGGRTRQRKLPLVIHVDPQSPLSLNMTCRYCPSCDLPIAHQDVLESLMARIFDTLKPEVVGNQYLVLGTMERADWKRGLSDPISSKDMAATLHDFKDYVHFTPGGWGR